MNDSIFCFQANIADISTEELFQISSEGNYLRVENKNVNLLYNGLTKENFQIYFNYFNKFINFDFSPVIIKNKMYFFSNNEREYLTQITVTNSIYIYIVNGSKIVLKPNRISLEVPFDALLALLDKTYGADSELAIIVGAHILRQSTESFRNNARQRRQYYNK